MSQGTYGTTGRTYGETGWQYGQPTEWTLLTGPKGAAGSPLALPRSRPFRRFCAAASANVQTSLGFQFLSTWTNYTPTVSSALSGGQGHTQVQCQRDSAGRVSLIGLAYANGSPTDGKICTLAWDMYPWPAGNRVCTVGDCNNQRSRFDVYAQNPYEYFVAQDQTAVAAASGVFCGLNGVWQTAVPSCWVDYGLQVVGATDTGAATSMVGLFQVSSGQVSGVVKGQPMSLYVPSQTVRLPVTVGGGQNGYGFVWVDMVRQVIGGATYTYPTSMIGNPPEPLYNPNTWMELAEEGKVVIWEFLPDYTTGYYSADPTRNWDHRWFARDPMDWGRVGDRLPG